MSVFGALALLIGACVGWRGLRRVRHGLRNADSLALVRGIRALVTAAVATVCAIALFTGQRGLLAFAAVFLAEELYETGVLVLIIRASPAGSGT